MIFTETPLQGAFVLDLEHREDERGFFARSWCQDEFAQHGLETRLVQCNISFNAHKGILRGMHYQAEPYPEAKLVRCTMGAIYDVIVDLRSDSATYKQWFAMELTAANRRALYVPAGFAHGFQTLENNSEVFYQMSEFFHPECARGIRWDDPAFGIKWPIANWIISDKDRRWPLLKPDSESDSITREMKAHYSKKFAEFGATSRGVDWGKEEDVRLRYEKMLAVIRQEFVDANKHPTLLDVGCGFGGLLGHAQETNPTLNLQYSGIDVTTNMISWAKEHFDQAEFIEGDFLQFDLDERKFDFIVCNGILTQKLDASLMDMDRFAKKLIRKMFDSCNTGIAFNVMSSYVNFYAPNLYYKQPSEMLSYCLSEISHRVMLDHSYGLYEYTLYIYK